MTRSGRNCLLRAHGRAPFGSAGGFGYQEDANGFKLLGHRYYDPSTGRFLTRDPIKDGRNWYTYCENNVLQGADSAGLSPDRRGGGESRGRGDDPLYDLSPKELEELLKSPGISNEMRLKIIRILKEKGSRNKKKRKSNLDWTPDDGLRLPVYLPTPAPGDGRVPDAPLPSSDLPAYPEVRIPVTVLFDLKVGEGFPVALTEDPTRLAIGATVAALLITYSGGAAAPVAAPLLAL